MLVLVDQLQSLDNSCRFHLFNLSLKLLLIQVVKCIYRTFIEPIDYHITRRTSLATLIKITMIAYAWEPVEFPQPSKDQPPVMLAFCHEFVPKWCPRGAPSSKHEQGG